MKEPKASASTSSAAPNDGALKLTDEQQAVVTSEGNLKVEAVAGAGKTSTLIAYARRRPQATILYLAFNRAVRMHAQQRFAAEGLRNVSIETAHSLAFRMVGKSRKIEVTPGWKALDLSRALELDRRMADRRTGIALAQHVLLKTAHFCNSTAMKIDQCDYLPSLPDKASRDFATTHQKAVNTLTRQFMQRMYDNSLPMTHDFYLKLFHYQMPKLPYQYVLLDEGQDASPVMLDIFARQAGHRIIVGDPHQQIYGWRGAVNSLEAMSYPTLPLTQSFRFPPTIAQLAYEVLYLKRHLGLTRFPHIVGKGKGGKVVSRAILARSNMGLIEAAIEELANKRKMYFEGNFNSYLYSGNQGSLYDVLFLYAGQHAKIHSDLVRSVRDFGELEQYASDIADPDLRLMCRLVKKYKTELFGMLDELKRLQPARPEDADLILQTVHRAKGLEYDSVILADDFISPAILKRTLSENDVEVVRDELNEELNILYVAVTRAKRQVEVPDTLATLLPQDKPAGK